MSAFGGLILTNKGRALQTKAQTGTQLNFTKVKVGDGELSGQSILELNDLISPKKELNILELKTMPEGKASLKSYLDNTDIVTGFYWRELGVFAQDPDEGEILYCYGNAGANAEYIPAGGGADVLEKYINVITIVGNASNITATLGSQIYVTQADLDAHINNTNNPHNVTKAQVGLGNVDNVKQIPNSEKGQPNGVATLDANGQVPAIQIPDNVKEIKVVNTIADRDSLLVYEGLRVHVIDASDDPTVDSGWAEYLWDGSQWVKTAENESIDIVLDWANIQNKPSTFTPSTHDNTKHSTNYASETAVSNHVNDTSNPHNVTYSQVGAAAASHSHSEYATDTDLSNHTGDTSNPHNVTKSQIGLGSVVNARQMVARNGGQNIWVQSSQPTALATGDIWIDTSA